eukprot:m.165752 g.165752  ORF g.165752 m.165752 type:complete len:666 (+) comp14431_c1_seq31:81-2078(+)
MSRPALGQVSASQMNSRVGRLSLGAPTRVKKEAKGRKSLAPDFGRGRRSMAGDRKSLGGRPSLGASRRSIGGDYGRQSLGGRQSLAGSGRMSMSGRMSLSGRRQTLGRGGDPRPLSDKAYKSATIRNLIQFLTENGYDSTISPKLLSAPSITDFTRIFKFIHSFLDDAYPWEKAKPEEEIPLILKNIGYPFPVKSSLVISCGSPHNWPKLLGALQWMVELVQFTACRDAREVIVRAQDADQEMSQNAEEEEAEVLFLDYSEKAYNAFLQDEGAKEAFEDDLRESFQSRNQEIAEEFERLTEENEELMQQTEELDRVMPPLEELRKKKQAFTSDKAKFDQFIETLQGKMEKNQQKLERASAELQHQQSELQRLQQINEELKAKRDAQKMTPQDVERIRSQQRQLDRSIASNVQRKELAEKETWKLESNISKQEERVERTLAEWNRLCLELGLTQDNVDNPIGLDCRLSLQKSATAKQELLNLSLEETVKPALAKFRQQLEDRKVMLSRTILEVKDRSGSLTDAIQSKQDDITFTQQRIQTAESQKEAASLASRDAQHKHMSTVDSMSRDLDQMQASLMSKLADSAQQLEEARQKHQHAKAEVAGNEERLQRLIFEAASAAVSYKVRVHVWHCVFDLSKGNPSVEVCAFMFDLCSVCPSTSVYFCEG